MAADNTKIVKNLFYYVERHLFGADSDSGDELLNKGQFGVMMAPGQFVSPNWQENDGSVDMYNQFQLLDETLDTSFTYRPQITTISGQYWSSLDKVSLRHRPLTKAEIAELKTIDSEISTLQPRYEMYERRFNDADQAFEFEKSKQYPNQARLRQLLQQKNNARSAWESVGRKSYYENNLVGRSWQIQTGNPAGAWMNLRNTFQNAKRVSPQGEYQITLLQPPISAWANSGWASFTKSIDDTETHHYSKSTSWSGGIGASWGLFNHINVGANGEKTVVHDVSDVTAIDVTFEYLRCRIIRPWISTDLFANKDWTWKEPNSFIYLSDGGNLFKNPPVRPLGTIPFLQTTLIAVRNVIIRADFSHTDKQEMMSRISGSASAGFGCFSIRGSYTETTHTIDVKATFDGTELRIPQPQIIGYLGILLPKSPDPNRAAKYWGADAVFPDQPDVEQQGQFNTARRRDGFFNKIEREYTIECDQIDQRAEEEKAALLRGLVKRPMVDDNE